MDIVDLTSDDDSFEAPEFRTQSSKPVIANPTRSTASQHFKQVMISSDSSDEETIENVGPTFSGRKTVDATPKIIGLGPEDTASTNFPLETSVRHPQGAQVDAHPQPSHGTSKPGPRRFFRWGSSEDNVSSSMIKKRGSSSPSTNEAKKRNIEFDNIEEPMTIGGAPSVPDGSSEANPNCGGSGGDVGLPMPTVVQHHRLEIAGVKVAFPLTPYPAQKAVMNALIRGCKNEEHSLVESPTGSGKTLALLCGALAWQSHYAENYGLQAKAYIDYTVSLQNLSTNPEDDTSGKGEENKCTDESKKPTSPPKFPEPTPKIYYGSRTHRQISQVSKELRRTAYRDTKMTILSSREFTCIQHSTRNKTEICNELLDPLKRNHCAYYNETNKQEISHYNALQRMNFPMPFDIEDIVTLGSERGCCPYFGARNLMAEADLVLCPYNYLIDPAIRKSMQINLKGAIVILDEAHNIEDICRESASSSFTTAELEAVITDCEEFHKHFASRSGPEPWFLEVCYYVCRMLKKFIETVPDLKRRDKNSNSPLYSTIWNGQQFQEVLHVYEISPSMAERFLKAITEAADHQIQVREEIAAGATFGIALSMATIRTLQKCEFALKMLKSREYCSDFRVFVKETTEWMPPSKLNRMAASGVHPETVRTLECLCLNPGVIFSSLAESARSIILASGTLAPISSFASELGTTFKQVLQNKHVIPKDNAHIRIVPRGPQGISLKAVYANTSQWNFQDELGRVILEVCESVPFGVLCFLPSYSLLDTISRRICDNGLMDRIKKLKVVFTEPRKNSDLDEVMRQYRNTIKNLTDNPREDGCSGALLFAVFRGKVAEGIDFSDNEARAVITIGIPYAIWTEPSVDLKVKYNDENQNKGKNLLRGELWYKIQAYRALNQALGRCIRHINDWGVILLVDERLMITGNQEYLPKWVKTIWGAGPKNDFQTLGADLRRFVRERTEFEELRRIGGA